MPFRYNTLQALQYMYLSVLLLKRQSSYEVLECSILHITSYGHLINPFLPSLVSRSDMTKPSQSAKQLQEISGCGGTLESLSLQL